MNDEIWEDGKGRSTVEIKRAKILVNRVKQHRGV